MLRNLVLLLLSANILYFAWSEGLLQSYGLSPTPGSEPHRIDEQLQPQAIQPIRAQDVPGLAAAATATAECLRSGPWDMEQAAGLRTALQAALPQDSWRLDVASPPPRWIIYMGKFSSQDMLKRKLAQLTSIESVKAQTPRDPALIPGISLGGFDTEPLAQAELARINRLGVRTARVVQDNDPTVKNMLLIPSATKEMQPALLALQPLLAAHALQPCE
jgi:hypothetical protein